MTQKQYFLFLWLLSSLGSIFFVIYTIIQNSGANDSPPVAVIFHYIATNVLLTIAINGVMVAIGLYCAQKIGARLLLLDGNYDCNKDVLKPINLSFNLEHNVYFFNFLKKKIDLEFYHKLVEIVNLIILSLSKLRIYP